MGSRSELLVIITMLLLCFTTATQKLLYGSAASHSKRPSSVYTRCSPRENFAHCIHDVLEPNSRLGYADLRLSFSRFFTVGFFIREESAYLGIWYNNTEDIIVWVANRDKPIPSRVSVNCSLTIADDGNAMIVDSYSNRVYWSTNLSNSLLGPKSNTYLEIQDSGNFVLWNTPNEESLVLWQSFDHPTDTFLPGMNATVNLTSWKTPTDPWPGNYILGVHQGDEEDDSAPSIGLRLYNTSLSSAFSRGWDISPPDSCGNVTSDFRDPMYDPTLRLVMNATGSAQLWKLSYTDDAVQTWSIIWSGPNDECDLYHDVCGINGVCDAENGFRCKCLPGYHPVDPANWWYSQDFSSGCAKNTNNSCGDMFVTLPMVKLPLTDPHLYFQTENEEECKDRCLSECGQNAYSFDTNQSACRIWQDKISRVQEEYYTTADAHPLHIRLTPSDIESGKRTCIICGANVIPYPLSTSPSCGDPAYQYFECNLTNGQLYFKPPSGRAYKLTQINQQQTNFTVQLVAPVVTCDSNYPNIESKEFHFDQSSPFYVSSCGVVQLMRRPPVVEVQLSWNLPQLTTCDQSVDCSYWPNTKCGWDKIYGKKVCMCANGRWDPIFRKCTKGHQKHLILWISIATAASLLILSSSIGIFVLLQRRATHTAGSTDQYKIDDMEDIAIPFIEYQTILAATDNFSDANKLGVGGFGPVYRGVLADGNEVAVKRLSEASMQGALEFKNEIVLIAKLQHRNLVKVIGYCISDVEKILIYEYMPNKSLDLFLFNQTAPPLLDWKKRFDIILGIARGLLYLHQDSRLRIVHRDLKPGNILLDRELNPKISDFGLAKIIAGNDMATNTARVVGTYGYMSPEYALEGYFSIKSDVYSFGIIVFEIISGRRCTSLLPLDKNLISLLGYAWDLWTQGKELELVDKSIKDACDGLEAKRCIIVALLCAQEDPSERPTMSSVLFMLSGDNANLPSPKQPVFVARRQNSTTSNLSGTRSNVEFSTSVQAR